MPTIRERAKKDGKRVFHTQVDSRAVEPRR